MIATITSNRTIETLSVFDSVWSTVCSWPLEVKIGLVLSAIAAVGAIKILWPKRGKPKLVDCELFIHNAISATGALLFRCTVRNNGTKLFSVEKVKMRFDGNVSLRKGGCVNIRSSDEYERYITSTKLPVNVPPDASEDIIVVGHIGNSEKYPSKATINIEFSGKMKPITKVVQVNEQNIIESYGNIPK